mmetsp:Transcript_26852/g.30687  ORF Transcript_26852/g.30687 Transcript_26852/m.30687 type:complete len:81 (-) Transcript_26852:892-1134(-)
MRISPLLYFFFTGARAARAGSIAAVNNNNNKSPSTCSFMLTVAHPLPGIYYLGGHRYQRLKPGSRIFYILLPPSFSEPTF